jgi:Fe-S-cluster containining protein
MPRSAKIYDCMKCGACCASPWTADGYVYLYDIDIKRLKRTGIIPVVQQYGDEPVRKLPVMVNENGQRVCAQLSGTPGSTCKCTIYRRRPTACRTFKAGDVLCREARERLGLAGSA